MNLRINEEYSKIVRPLSEAEYQELKNSIKERGLHIPITVNQDYEILDGHNRYKACQELGVKVAVIVKEFKDPGEAKLFVIESNLKRRHLSDIERIELGRLLEEKQRELGERRRSETIPEEGEKGFQPVSGSNEHHTGKTRDIIAEKVGVSPTTYHRGKTVLDKGSDKLKQEVKEGKTSISQAYEEVKGRDKKPKKHAAESSDILMLPEDKFQATKDAINEAIALHDKQVVLRHDKHKVISVGKEIEVSTA